MTREAGNDARAGVRAMVARGADGLRRMSPSALIALLCASAVAPVLVASGAVAVGGAVAGVVGSVGANVLTEVITKTIERFRTAPAEEIEQALAERIEAALAAGDARADRLRADVAAVLREVGAVEAALEATVTAGDDALQDHLAEAFATLGLEFDEFAFLLAEVRTATSSIKETLLRQDREHRVDRERLRHQSTQLRLIEEKVSLIERRTRNGPVGEARRWGGDCPYRGLWPFEEDHAEIFYGRERLTAELVGRCAEAVTGSGMVVVTGASGAGKSSLLRAGLLPALARGSLTAGSATWPRITITPTRDPLGELATHLAALAGSQAAAVRRALLDHPADADLTVRQALLTAGSSERLILVVDQFEEVFTLGTADTFIQILSLMTASALVVLGVRGDYLDRCAEYPALVKALQEGQFVVGPMTEPELRQAITGPAAAAGLTVEPGLTETILARLRSTGPGALPLLSQAMLVTWEHREEDRLTSRGYARSGGIDLVVATSADAVYHALPAGRQEVARQVILRMTGVARDGRGVRRTVRRVELGETAEVTAVLAAFAAKRLVILHDEQAEIAHDVLLSAWPRLRGWLREDETERILYSQLLDDADEWFGHERDPSFLYRGFRLARVEQALSPPPGLAGEFLAAATAARIRRARRLRVLAGVLGLLLTAAVGAGGVAVDKAAMEAYQNEMRVARQTAARAEAIRDTDPVRAMLLSVASWRIAGVRETRAALYTSLAQRESHVTRWPELSGPVEVNLSWNGDFAAVANRDRVFVWDLIRDRRTAEFAFPAQAVAVSRDGSTLAIGGAQIGLWDTKSGRAIRPPFGGRVRLLEFSPRGRLLVSVGERGWQIWQVGADVPLVESPEIVESVDVSPDEKSAAVVFRDRRFELRELPSGRKIDFPVVRADAVAFNPGNRAIAVSDGKNIVIGERTVAAEGVVWMKYTDDGRHLLTFDGTQLGLRTADGQLLLEQELTRALAVLNMWISTDGRTVRYVRDGADVATFEIGDHIHPPRLTTAKIGAAEFGPGGRTVAFQADRLRIWDVARWRPLRAPEILDARALAFNSGILAVGHGNTPTITLWDISGQRQVGALKLTGPGWAVAGLAFTPDGRTLALTPWNGTYTRVQLWDVPKRRPIRTLAAPGGDIMAVRPDGRSLGIGGDNNALVDLPGGKAKITPFGPFLDGVRALAFSPDGSVIATGLSRGGAALWDIRHLTSRARLESEVTDPIVALAFTPDGAYLATGSQNGLVRIWDVAEGMPVGRPYGRHSGPVRALAFTEDELRSIGEDGTLHRYPISLDLAERAVCARAGTTLSESDWASLIPEAPYRKVC
ncbi:hypothetical protein Acor_57520 [Acrocarpospora corrugata]|uniref:Novel STAND NTPase 1 domain-containing protein n=1 Tax=Acrocarpospora corrugata TaxID=35763 RepID=A0A5M3W4L8_9ACTN|nr:AAA family ATPase [Acrocarpospora corrugata]GES03686.1 hypothetical protein Acor_57520 [Acrocarpospora corrugata]